MFPRASIGVALFGAMLAGRVAAQAAPAVSGQVTILERPGETTEDLGDVVVYLEPTGVTARPMPPAATNTVINLRSRQFSPRIVVVPEGTRIDFRNLDAFSHNVFSKANGGFDTDVFGRNKTRANVFQTAGVYPLYCNVHPRMTAYVISLNTPYFVQAGLDGRFLLENVAAGRYKMHVWHDRTSERVQDITVGARGISNLLVELDGRGYKYVQHKNKFGQDYTSTSGDRY
jgi:plastocyanin